MRLTKNWGDFICSLVLMLAYCVQRKFPDWLVARLVYTDWHQSSIDLVPTEKDVGLKVLLIVTVASFG